MKRGSIRNKLITLVLSCSLISIWITALLSVTTATSISKKDCNQIMGHQMHAVSTELEASMHMISQSVDTMANICLNQITDFEKFKTDSNYVTEYTKQIEQTAFEFAKNTDGALTCYVRYNPEFTEPTSGLFLTRDSADSEFKSVTPTDFSMYDKDDLEHVGWYYVPVNNEKPTWMDPYLNANINVYMISYVVPIYVDGVSVGIVGMDIDFSAITGLLDDFKLFDSGYAYLASSSDTVLYHPSAEVGTNRSEIKEDGRVTLETELVNGMKLITSVPQSEVNAKAQELTLKISYASFASLAIAFIICMIFSTRLVKPLKNITGEVLHMADLSFEPNDTVNKIANKKDETGEIAKGVQKLQEHMRTLVNEIENARNNLEQNTNTLYTTSEKINEMCSENSSVMQELAAGMEENTTAMTDVNDNISAINENAEEINSLSEKGATTARGVYARAQNLQRSTKDAITITETMYTEVKEKSMQALEQAKAIDKINDMIHAITEISEQTTLLALNASIEAARAGEAGKGFAVVASEIGTLANQTLGTVQNIDQTVSDVVTAVTNMSDCLQNTTEFLETKVLSGYSGFMDISDQYAKDADEYKNSMTLIQSSISELTNAMNHISETMSEITSNITEGSSGISGIAERTSQMAEVTVENSQQAENSRESLDELKNVINKISL